MANRLLLIVNLFLSKKQQQKTTKIFSPSTFYLLIRLYPGKFYLLYGFEKFMVGTVSDLWWGHYKVHHGIHPRIITNLFTKKTYTNMPITRQKQHYIIPMFKSKSFERSIAIQGPKYYNDFMNKINVNCSIHTYKKKLISYLIDSL